jgi:hypothetical protein
MKFSDVQGRVSPELQDLSTKLLALATSSWETLGQTTAVTQEVAKDPFTGEAKAQAAAAELLLFLLHVCDRIASAAFSVTLSTQAAATLRTSFMSAVVSVAIPAFVRSANAEEDDEEFLEEAKADFLHLYNTRATQYGFFPLGKEKPREGEEPLFMLVGIRLAEALECPDNAEIINHGVDVVLHSLVALRTQLPLKETIGQLIASAQP